jgi:hypothetical protein
LLLEPPAQATAEATYSCPAALQVLPLFARLQAANGRLPAVLALQELMQLAEQQQRLDSQPVLAHAVDFDTAKANMYAAVQVAAAATAAAAAEQQGEAADSMLHRFRGVRKTRNISWEMRYAQRSTYFSTQLEAACAYDLSLLAAGGRPKAGGALNFPAQTYNSEQVRRMAQYMQAKEQQRQQQQQHVLQQEQQADPQQRHPGGKGQPAQSAPSAVGSLGERETRSNSSTWGLVRQLLLSPTGRQLLVMSPAAAEDRLQTLSSLTGFSKHQLLQRFLGNSSTHYSANVLRSSPARLEASAVSLQQLLQLPHAGLQSLLQRAPSVLTYRTESMTQKLSELLPALQSCCEAAGYCLVNSNLDSWDSITSTSCEVWGQHSSTGREGIVSLQRAVLHTPEVLLLSAARVQQRLAVLEGLCSQPGREGLAEQLRQVLGTGGIGRWLTAGKGRNGRELCAGKPIACSYTTRNLFVSDVSGPSLADVPSVPTWFLYVATAVCFSATSASNCVNSSADEEAWPC